MVYVAICDLNPMNMDTLEAIIFRLCGTGISITKYSNPYSLMFNLLDKKDSQTDAVFMNTRLGELDGIDVARELKCEIPLIDIIFMAEGYNVVDEMFSINTFYCLTIPFQRKYVKDAVEKLLLDIQHKRRSVAFVTPGKYRTKMISIESSQIVYIESEKRKIHVHAENGTYTFYEKLNNIQNRIGDGFVRCHQSYLVRLSKVKAYNGNALILKNCDKIIPVSRSRQQEVRDIIRDMHL